MSAHLEPLALRRVELSPDEFRVKAFNAGWAIRTTVLFLTKPYCRRYVDIGDPGEGRVRALVVERGGE